jgi:catechol 2,3-dioxygenase-like lactoylglutathione lyase family enzyme
MHGARREGRSRAGRRSRGDELPAQDLNRGRAFYNEKLGLEPTVAMLNERGVVFEEYDLPTFGTVEASPRSTGTIRAKGPTASAAPGFATPRRKMLGIGWPHRALE